MIKQAHDLAKIAEDLHSVGMRAEAKSLLFTAIKIAHDMNPLSDVLGENGYEKCSLDESLSEEQLPVDGIEIWIHLSPEGLVYERIEGDQVIEFDNLENLVANESDDSDCGCGCGGSCKTASKNKSKKLNKPFRTPGGPKKFSVYVKNDKGNVVKVNFGDPNMSIKRDDPERRKNFRARHNCDNPGPKTKARFWSCKFWSKPSVTNLLKGKK